MMGVLLKRGTENGTENGTELKTKWNGKRNESFVGKQNYMNFVDTRAYKGKRFEIKQNLDFWWNLSKQIIYFQYLDLTHAHNPSVFKVFIKLEGEKVVIWEIQTTHVNSKKKCEWIQNQPHFQRLYGDLEINQNIQDALVSHYRNRALHDCEK